MAYDTTKFKGLVTCIKKKQEVVTQEVVEVKGQKSKRKHLKCHMLGTDGQRLALDLQKYAGLRTCFKTESGSHAKSSSGGQASSTQKKSDSCSGGGCGSW